MKKSLKTLMRSGTLTVGSWITLAHPAIAEIMCRAGFDWLTVDLEHSVITIREAEELIRIIELSGLTSLVRLSNNDTTQIKRVMDAGAHGVIVPMINSREDAEKAIKAVKYAPLGNRGVGLARAQGYGSSFERYRSWVAEESIVIAQIEHIDAVHELDAILQLEELDGIIVGPYDLSNSLGVPGEFEHTLMKEAFRLIEEVARRFPQKALGYHVVPPQPELLSQAIEDGYTFIAFSADMLFLSEACRAGIELVKRRNR